ncbi:hypothetical protein LCGC14_1459170 [marine sediment metagenome]|uniref:Uncharacterized protein n=1 Tax=marine sediment metagenome TaxID=412755 RepID=A0A0F9MHJ9_9ZZZZ
MALTVRFPNGQAITYNDVNEKQRIVGGWELIKKDRRGEKWQVAIVLDSSGAILEWVNPCTIENPLEKITDRAALERLRSRLQEAGKNNPGALGDMKRELAGFNLKTYKWKKRRTR